jgi:thioredoxin reductase
MTEVDESYDVVVIGGGPAGLGGGLALARARRSVLVVDGGEPRNAPAGHVHHVVGHDGTPPAVLAQVGRSQLARYGGQVVAGRTTALRRDEDRFRVELADGRSVRARRLLVATGLTDELPAVPGVAELWGRTVLHCPYCHGWEVRDGAIGVLGTGPQSAMQALLWRQWSDDVVLFQHAGPTLRSEESERLDARGVRVVPGEVVGLDVAAGALSGVRLASGEVVARDVLVVAPRFVANADLLAPLGVEVVDQEMHGAVRGSRVPAGPGGLTAVPGVWVAGNVGDISAQVMASAVQGLDAGAAINVDLLLEDVQRAVAAARASAPDSVLVAGG